MAVRTEAGPELAEAVKEAKTVVVVPVATGAEEVQPEGLGIHLTPQKVCVTAITFMGIKLGTVSNL